MNLAELQHWFAGAIMEGDDLNRARAVPSPSDLPGLVDHVVLPSRHLTARERVAIYQQAYHLRLIECLTDDYPALAHALGESTFGALARAYIAAHPSQSSNLNGFGRQLSAFCRDSGAGRACHATTALPPFAADLAELEWALVEVLHAPSGLRVSSESLAHVAPERWPSARFVPAPTLRLVGTRFAVNAYFQSFRDGEEPSAPQEVASATAVFRDGLTLWRMDLPRPMEVLLRSLVAGCTLGEAFAALDADGPLGEEAAPRVMASFREWVAHGLFASIELPRLG